MLDWIINIPLYALAVYMFGIVLYFGLRKEDEDDDPEGTDK